MAYTVEWGTPVLHMRSPDGRLFDIDALPAVAPPTSQPAPPPVVEVAAPVEPVVAPIEPAPAAPRPAARAAREAAPPARSEGINRKVLMWSAVSAGVVLVLAVAAFFLLTEPADDVGEDEFAATGGSFPGGVEESLPPIGRVLLIPAVDTLRTGQTLRIGVSLVDSLGKGMNEQGEFPDVLTWMAEPAGIVTITPDAEGLGAVVRGEASGTVSITATAAADASMNQPADTKRITVLTDAARMSEVLARYIETERRFNDPAVSNADVVAAYEGLSPADRRALVESGRAPERHSTACSTPSGRSSLCSTTPSRRAPATPSPSGSSGPCGKPTSAVRTPCGAVPPQPAPSPSSTHSGRRKPRRRHS